MKMIAIWGKIKYEIVIFAVLAVQGALTLARGGGIPTNFLTFYLLDYNLGFIPRAFIGSVAGLLTRRMTEQWLTGFILLTFLLVYALLALLLGAMLRRVPAEQKPAVVCLLAVFLFANFSVRVFIQNIGLPDIFLFLFALLAAVCLKNKYAKWLVPLLCIAGAATHYGFIFIFFPPVFTLTVYELARAKQKTGAAVRAAAGAAATVASSVYFMLFSNNFVKMDSDQVYAYLQSKADFPVWRYFVDGILFYTDNSAGVELDGFSGFMAVLKETAAEGFRPAGFAGSILLLTPLFLFFFYVWKGAFKQSARRLDKIVFLLCIALPLPLLPWFVFSTDTPRFLGEIFVAQFTVLFYMLYDRNEAVAGSLKKAETFFKKYPLVLLLLLASSLSAAYFK